MLMKAGTELARKYDFGALRFLAQRRRAAESGGGRLGPGSLRPAVPRQLVADGDRRNHDRQLRRDGRSPRLDGPAAARRRGGDRPARRDDRVEVVTEPDVQGELALRPGWPSMFRGYWGEEERYRKCFVDGWYLTGDLARRDRDGYFWFVGRADDVIKTSGHLIGPFEVESVLMEHPAVAEAGVIGKPDPVAMEVVKAFVSLKAGRRADARASGASCWPSRARGSARWSRRRRSTSAATCRGRGAARSCAGCSRRASSGCPRATSRRSRNPHDAAPAPRPRAGPSAPDGAHPPLRGEGGRALHAWQDPRLPPSLHRRGGGGRRRDAGADARRRRSWRPTASTARRWRAASRPAPSWRRCTARPTGAAAGAAARCTSSTSRGASTAATPSSAAGCRSPSGWPSPTGCRRGARVTACFFGDGAVAEGEFHESLNLAALWKLPVLFLCENNLYAMGTALARHQAQTDIRLQGGGLRDARPRPSTAWTCWPSRRRRAGPPRACARGDGPFLLELRTYRFRAHSMYDPELYRAKDEVERWKARDPIALFAALPARAGARSTDADLAAVEASAVAAGRRRGRDGRGRAVGTGRGSHARTSTRAVTP